MDACWLDGWMDTRMTESKDEWVDDEWIDGWTDDGRMGDG